MFDVAIRMNWMETAHSTLIFNKKDFFTGFGEISHVCRIEMTNSEFEFLLCHIYECFNFSTTPRCVRRIRKSSKSFDLIWYVQLDAASNQHLFTIHRQSIFKYARKFNCRFTVAGFWNTSSILSFRFVLFLPPFTSFAFHPKLKPIR